MLKNPLKPPKTKRKPYLIFFGIFGLISFILFGVSYGQNTVPLLKSDSARIIEAQAKAAKEAAINDLREQSRYYDIIAFIYWEHNYFRDAIEWYKKSLVLNEKLSNQAGASMINSNLGMLYADLREYENSLAHFQKTLDYRRMMKDKQGMITTAINLSVVLNNLKRYDESATLLQQSLTMARELNDPDQMKSCYGMLSETYEKARQSDKAKYYFDLYRTFHEQVQKEKEQQSKKMVEETQLKLQLTEVEKKNKELELQLAANELKIKEKELVTANQAQRNLYLNLSSSELRNELLKRDNQLKETNIANERMLNHRQRTQLLVLTIGLILFVVALVFILKAYFDKRKTNRLLAQQKAEIERQRDAIEVAYNKLSELSAYKEGIRSMIVHDLKNPLNAILNPPNHYSDQLKLDTARKAGKQMLNLVMDILDVHKMEESKLTIHLANHHLKSLLQEAIEEVSYLGQSRGLLFKLHCDDELFVKCDKDLLQRVLVNLLTNAVKYAYQQTEIRVEATLEPQTQKVRVAVANQGDGIPESFRNKVFEKFSQHAQVDSGSVRSTGIGLTFCKLAIEAHQHSVHVDSIPNKTTTFWFHLHQASSQAKAAPSAKMEQATEQPKLTPTDQRLLHDVVRELKTLELHQITKIRKVLRTLDNQRTPQIDHWILQLYAAIETNDFNKYNNLINNHDNTNSASS